MNLLDSTYETDTGPIDILAISRDKKELLVVELKKGRASDSVVGQIQRYMGYVQEELAEDNQRVRGAIIALEDDLRIRQGSQWFAANIEFFRYEVKLPAYLRLENRIGQWSTRWSETGTLRRRPKHPQDALGTP